MREVIVGMDVDKGSSSGDVKNVVKVKLDL